MVFHYQLGPTEIILLSVAFVLLLVQLFYYLCIYLRPVQYSKACQNNKVKYAKELPAVSVIVYAKNDAHSLEKFLPLLLEQDYPDFEVIVVNDGSTDDSKDTVSLLKNKHPHLYQTYVPEGARNVSRKKLALTVGIKAAKNDIILLTDANCRPQSNRWIESICRNFTPGTDVVLGYAFFQTKHKYIGLYMNWDGLYQSMRYLSFAILRWPYRGVGSNLAYRKKKFFEAKGFSKHLNLHFGDDDLFINEITNHKNTRVEISPESQIMIATEYPGDEWREKKLQHDFTRKFIKSPAKNVFRIEMYSRFLFFAALVALCCLFCQNLFILILAVLLWLIRYVVQIVVLQKNKRLLSAFTAIPSYPLYDLLEPVINVQYKIMGWITRKKNYTWRFKS